MAEPPFDEVETSHHYRDVINLSELREWGDESQAHTLSP